MVASPFGRVPAPGLAAVVGALGSASGSGVRPRLGPGPCAAGQAASTCPALVLELVFRQLKIGDLVACSLVCRHWHQLATGRRMQMHCLESTYTRHHRQYMQQAFDSARLRASLVPCCSGLASEAEPRPEEGQRPSSQELLLRVVWRSLMTESLYPHFLGRTGPSGGGRQTQLQTLSSSPDGECFVVSGLLADGQPSYCWMVTRTAPAQGGLKMLRSPRDMSAGVCCATFSADGQSLRVLYKTGELELWRRDADRNWQIHPVPSLAGGLLSVVFKVVLSPDQQHLAALGHNGLSIYGAGEEGSWGAAQFVRVWNNHRMVTFLAGAEQLCMKFSPDNHHFVFALNRVAVVCVRDGVTWRTQTLGGLARPVRGAPVFAADSRLLALAVGQVSRDGFSVGVHIKFWQFERGQGWQPVSQANALGSLELPARAHPVTGYRVPMAFSPDGQLLVVPARDSCQDVMVLPCKRPGDWRKATRLPGMDHGSGGVVRCVQFSASSVLLAVRTQEDVCVWKTAVGWELVFVIGSAIPGERLPFSFSPDGYHCAMAFGPRHDEVVWWGPRAAGGYGRKGYFSLSLQRKSDARVQRLMFTPDGMQMLVAFSCKSDMPEGARGVRTDFRYENHFLLVQLFSNGPGLTAMGGAGAAVRTVGGGAEPSDAHSR